MFNLPSRSSVGKLFAWAGLKNLTTELLLKARSQKIMKNMTIQS
jgi:hypothetical protein